MKTWQAFSIHLTFYFQFIQISNESSPENVFKLMTEKWKVDKPQILISVTGGAKSCNLKPKLKDMFVNGLRKVLHSFLFLSSTVLNLYFVNHCTFISTVPS